MRSPLRSPRFTPPSPAARAIKVARAAPRKHAPGRVSTLRARVSTLRRVSTAQIRGNAPGRGNADRGRVYAPRRVNAAQTVETRPGVEARPKSKKTRPIAKTQFGSVQTRPAVEKRPIPRFHGTTVALKVEQAKACAEVGNSTRGKQQTEPRDARRTLYRGRPPSLLDGTARPTECSTTLAGYPRWRPHFTELRQTSVLPM